MYAFTGAHAHLGADHSGYSFSVSSSCYLQFHFHAGERIPIRSSGIPACGERGGCCSHTMAALGLMSTDEATKVAIVGAGGFGALVSTLRCRRA